ncbi:MAG: type II toxin-antitoxin system VapC family toxin [Pirellulales bacterium]|nr:type II toxin-antitoxin system VapC family toxin [Pirellulales bacterium]
MNRLFADSFYYFAILNPRDELHSKALEFATRHEDPIVTTAWVLTEITDGLAGTKYRAAFSRLIARIQADPENEIVPPSDTLMARGIELYDARSDKQWSLTDCISFRVMEDRRITQALTGDHHFEQAGFEALLK